MRPTPKMIALRMKTRLSGDGGALTSPSLLPGNTKTAPLTGAGRLYRPVMFALAVVLGLMGLAITALRVQAFAERGLVGVDFRLFSEIGGRWLETGSMYQPYQLAGPYAFDRAAGTNAVWDAPALYPPLAGPLFAFLHVGGALTVALWWLVPCAVLVYALVRWRPAPWTWPLLAAVTLWPSTAAPFITGNTTMLVAAGVAGGLLWGWPVLVIALKPTFAPFLLLGIRRRSWWAGAELLAVVSLLMLPEWLRYVTVLRNVTGAGLTYSINDLPLVLVPVVAWLGRFRRSERDDERSGRQDDVDRP